MASMVGNLALAEQRTAPREEVFYRTRARTPAGASVPLQIVNISANGFMARSEEELTAGDVLQLKLPSVGTIGAEIRWALGGRLGCQFDRTIALVPYLDMLGDLVRDAR